MRTALEPARSAKRVGRTLNHLVAAMRRPTGFGVTSTTTRWAPTLCNRIVVDAGASSATRAGETASATGSGPAPAASAEEHVATAKALPATARAVVSLTGRPR